MIKQVVSLAASAAALMALLIGLAQEQSMGTIVRRAVLGYVVAYAVAALLAALLKIGLTGGASEPEGAELHASEAQGTSGTDSAN